MSKTTIEELVAALAVAVSAHERAKSDYVPVDNPFANHDLTAMTKAGLLKSSENYPAVNMAAKTDPMLGVALEEGRNASIAEGRADTGQKRHAQARARKQRMADYAKIDARPMPDRARLDDGWAVTVMLMPIVQRVASGKARWASRYLGDAVADVPTMAMERMAVMLARQDKYDLDDLLVAAIELADYERDTGRLPGHQGEPTKEERKERKRIRQMRKWLLGMVNNRVRGAIEDAYRENPNHANLDLIETTMGVIAGGDSDPLFNSFKTGRAPAFLGTRFQRPDGLDSALIAAAISAAITDRGLDPLVEFMLDEQNRRTDGAINWTRCAQDIFLLTPQGQGEWMWEAVMGATTVRRNGQEWPMDRARKARGDAARQHVRNLFEFLPRVIVALVESFDPHPIGYSVEAGRKVLASDFELFYAPAEPERREMFSPVLRFGSVEEAMSALLEHISDLVTGEDVLNHVLEA